MSIELGSDKTICTRCGTAYGRRKGYFAVCYCESYKGVGYMHVCKDCLEKIYNTYLAQCSDAKRAVRQTCRKLDLYWNEGLFDTVMRKNTTRTVMTQYVSKINSITYAGKSYDDTLSAEGILWSFADEPERGGTQAKNEEPRPTEEEGREPVPQELIDFWGVGYGDDVYRILDQKYNYYLSRLQDGTVVDIGTELLLKNVAVLEYDIGRCIAEGKATDKMTNALNTALDGLHMKPKQNKQDEMADMFANTPMGVWIERFEHHRPIPEAPDDLKTSRGIMRYVNIWLGHVLEMLGKKNPYKDLYDAEMDRLKVEPPVYDGDDAADEEEAT